MVEERMAQMGGGSAAQSTTARTLGMFDFDQDGRLTPNLPGARLGMDFHWRDRLVTTALHTDDGGKGGVMVFRALAGRVPSSAIAPDARAPAFEILRCLPSLLPSDWTLTVEPDHSLRLHTTIPVAVPALVSDLLTPAVRFCLAVSPLLDLLEENAMGLYA